MDFFFVLILLVMILSGFEVFEIYCCICYLNEVDVGICKVLWEFVVIYMCVFGF